MNNTARILRVLEYTGPADLLEKQLDQRAIKGTARFGPVTIREGMIGEYPEILGPNEPTTTVSKLSDRSD